LRTTGAHTLADRERATRKERKKTRAILQKLHAVALVALVLPLAMVVMGAVVLVLAPLLCVPWNSGSRQFRFSPISGFRLSARA
jgi:hypothetical protein